MIGTLGLSIPTTTPPNSPITRNHLFFRTKKTSSPLPRLSRFLTICFGFEVTVDSDPSFLERLSPAPWRRSHWWILRHIHEWCVGVRLSLVKEKKKKGVTLPSMSGSAKSQKPCTNYGDYRSWNPSVHHHGIHELHSNSYIIYEFFDGIDIEPNSKNMKFRVSCDWLE